MALYLVSYDIAEKDKEEYQGLWDELEGMGAIKILYSEWVIMGDSGAAQQIYDKIAPKTRQTDRLLVQEVTKAAVWDKLLIKDDDFRTLFQNARS